MKKILMLLAAVFMVFSFSMVGFAHNQNTAGNQTGSMCGPGERYFGEVSWVYPSTESMMVAGREGGKIFDLSKATMKGFPEANEFVTVDYQVVNGDRIISSVTVVPRKMAGEYVGVY